MYKKLHKRTARINNTSFTRNELINDKTKLSLQHVTVTGSGSLTFPFFNVPTPPNSDSVQTRPITTLCLTFLAVSLSFFLSTLLLSLSQLPNPTRSFFVCCSSVVLVFGLVESREIMPNWELKNCCQHDQVVFLATIGVFTVVILAVRFVLLSHIFFFLAQRLFDSRERKIEKVKLGLLCMVVLKNKQHWSTQPGSCIGLN